MKKLIKLFTLTFILFSYTSCLNSNNEKQKELELKEKELELKEKELALFVLAITDILNSNSEILVLGEKSSVVEKAFDKKLENNRAFLEGVVSRKKQLLPNIDKNI